MKRLICIVAVAMILIMPFSIMAGCAKDDGKMLLECSDGNFGKYDGNVVKDMSAYELWMETYANFIMEESFTREEYFSFSSSLATRNTHLIRKINGGVIYDQEVIVGTGFDKGTCAKRFYYDGENANYIYLTNAKKMNISYKKSTKEFNVKDWGSFKPYDFDAEHKDVVYDIFELKHKVTTYDIMSRDLLSSSHNDKVYEKDGIYYFKITIDCSTEKMNDAQMAAKLEFLDTLGAKEEGFKIDDTTLEFAVKDFDGIYKFVIWKRSEKYYGKHASTNFGVSCRQECLSYYDYGEVTITSEDLLNLA